ncbi:MAG TPA: VacJ family lipoprotein [Usitatibacter sp.]|nr:VacJ family lipoprotein [Usitatibacter sp.]
MQSHRSPPREVDPENGSGEPPRSLRTRAGAALAAAALILLAGCAAAPGRDPHDPWEALNRKTMAFNDAVDRTGVKPVAKAYVKVVPRFVRARVTDFFGNVADINTGLNDILQGKLPLAINDFGRIVVNTTFGVAGLWDVASRLGVDKRDEDFGQTLGVWGVPSGPYFVIPFLGPSTARDAPARIVDLSWYYPRVLHNDAVYWTLWGLESIEQRAQLLKAESVIEQAAIDRYLFVRDAWLERRRNQVYDGNPPPEKDEE